MFWVKHSTPALLLAPMAGITDAPMRALLTELGGFSFCVSEFFRISQDIPYPRAFRTHIPELKNGALTEAGVPVQIQLLGGDPVKLAASALRACTAGARAIDLNFGCPAPTVNRNDGGATLLKHPERIRLIVAAVREAVPHDIPVSAKLRLGWESMDDIYKNAEMAALGGANWITIHGRTKTQGYTPPAYWDPIGVVRRNLDIPVVANGEIWTLDDFRRCRDATGSKHFMIGRSALADPSLQAQIARELGLSNPDNGGQWRRSCLAFETREEWLLLFTRFAELCARQTDSQDYALCRIKQWLRLATFKRSRQWTDGLKLAGTLEEFFRLMNSSAGASIGSQPREP